ncbi:CoA-binding protein [Helicobacter bizzozeronii]|uniref:CoA-binding protein n=1 Tax=Helicobacter bizzozeronii TaxID=56877 RepID=UPI000CEEF1DF|nr:CoA-binding protein [Helicobacter bizzozeronii]GMT38273.1 CoA-binding protein [Helicobacter bizzozeronii]
MDFDIEHGDHSTTELILQYKYLAIVGLSPNPAKESHRVAAYLQEQGYHITPIYPDDSQPILGQKVYKTLSAALQDKHKRGETIFVVVVFRKPEAVLEVAKEMLQNDPIPLVFWMQLGIKNAEAKALLEAKGVVVVEDKCMLVEHQKLF